MENKELLEKVVRNRLEKSLSDELSPEEKKVAFDEAMAALDRQVEIERTETTKKEQLPSRLIKIIEIAGIPIVLTGIDIVSRYGFAKMMCNFEKDYTFTTTPGKSLSSFFRFKSR